MALYFNNPNGTDADNAPMMLFEIYDFAFEYTGTPCFPLTNLKRSNTTTDQATFSWDGNSAEYMIYWGPAASGTYTVPVEVSVRSKDVGIIGTYEIQVNIREDVPEEPSEEPSDTPEE